MKKKQMRQDEVNDAFYEQLVYENLELIIRKYQLMQKEKNEQAELERKMIEEEENNEAMKKLESEAGSSARG